MQDVWPSFVDAVATVLKEHPMALWAAYMAYLFFVTDRDEVNQFFKDARKAAVGVVVLGAVAAGAIFIWTNESAWRWLQSVLGLLMLAGFLWRMFAPLTSRLGASSGWYRRTFGARETKEETKGDVPK
jgi:hypothetical protein